MSIHSPIQSICKLVTMHTTIKRLHVTDYFMPFYLLVSCCLWKDLHNLLLCSTERNNSFEVHECDRIM